MGNDPIDQILKLTKLIGAKKVVDYIKEHKLHERKGHKKENICFDIIVAFENGDIKDDPPSDYTEFITPRNRLNATHEAIHLIKLLLTIDYVLFSLLRRSAFQLVRPSSTLSSIPSDCVQKIHSFVPLGIIIRLNLINVQSERAQTSTLLSQCILQHARAGFSHQGISFVAVGSC